MIKKIKVPLYTFNIFITFIKQGHIHFKRFVIWKSDILFLFIPYFIYILQRPLI